MSHDDKSEPQQYLISQAELEKYLRLERELQQVSARLGRSRRSLMSRMGGPARVEPGPLTLQVAYQDTGLTTRDEYGDETPILARRLIVYSPPNPDDAA